MDADWIEGLIQRETGTAGWVFKDGVLTTHRGVIREDTLKMLVEAIPMLYDGSRTYQRGYEEGYEEGYDAGYEEGKDDE